MYAVVQCEPDFTQADIVLLPDLVNVTFSLKEAQAELEESFSKEEIEKGLACIVELKAQKIYKPQTGSIIYTEEIVK